MSTTSMESQESIPRQQKKLLVVELNGSPRGGKGTINEGVAARYPHSATDETGADYRAVMWGMLHEGLVDPELPHDRIHEVVANLDAGQLTDFAARRWEIVGEYGKDALYAPIVADRVAEIGEIDVVRSAVKAGFMRRVETHVRQGETSILFVDGRNLYELIRKVDGAVPFLRFFVVCSNDTAAQRETLRESAKRAEEGSPMSDEEKERFFHSALESITRRRKKDEERTLDPVLPEDTAMQYWHNTHVIQNSVNEYARRFSVSQAAARQIVLDSNNNNYFRSNRTGVGSLAVIHDRQIVFDTNPIGRDEMIHRAHRVVEEALDQASIDT